jgi:hypothetical protein
MKIRVLVVAVLIMIVPASAQAPSRNQPLKISVASRAPGTATDVRLALLPLISSNRRYSLADSPSRADVQVRITCMPPIEGFGVTCASLYLYGPASYFGATTELSFSLTADSTSDTVAQRLFTNLLEDTTSDELSRANDTLMKIMFAMREGK